MYCDCFIWCGCLNLLCKAWVCIGWGGGVYENCVSLVVIRVLVFTVFCSVCTVFLYCFAYVYLFLFFLCCCKDYCHRVKIQLQ